MEHVGTGSEGKTAAASFAPGRLSALDGFRCLAILLVVGSHTGYLAQGGLAVAWFFALSGFLAAMPFTEHGERRFLSPKYILKFYMGKIVRVIPVYWLTLFVAWLVTPEHFRMLAISDFSSYTSMFQNMFFLKCQFHLWFLQQEMLFYLFEPLIMLGICALFWLFRKKNIHDTTGYLLTACLLLVIAFYRSSHPIIYLYGNGIRRTFNLWQIYIGMAGGYLYKAIRSAGLRIGADRKGRVLCDILIVCGLGFTVLSSCQFLIYISETYSEYYIGWQRPGLCTVIGTVMLLAIVLGEECLADRLLSLKPVVYLGQISFCIYLQHWYIMPHFKTWPRSRYFISVLLLSIIIATVFHNYIEKPLQMKYKKYSSRF